MRAFWKKDVRRLQPEVLSALLHDAIVAAIGRNCNCDFSCYATAVSPSIARIRLNMFNSKWRDTWNAEDTLYLIESVKVLSNSWDGRPFAHNRYKPNKPNIGVGQCPFGGGARSPSNTVWPGPRPIHPYQVTSWSIQPFGYNTPTSQTDMIDRQDRTSDKQADRQQTESEPFYKRRLKITLFFGKRTTKNMEGRDARDAGRCYASFAHLLYNASER